MPIAHVVLVVWLAILAGCNAGSDRPAIQTLETGVVTIAVTGTTVTDPLDPEEWMYRYADRLGRDLDLRVVWEVVPVLAEQIIRENLQDLASKRTA